MTGGTDMDHILVTGGLGFIGSHTTLELLEAGYKVTIVDNLSNSFITVLSVIRRLSGPLAKNLSFFEVDLRDGKALNDVFASSRFDCVIHFAAFKAVGESAQKPVMYYDNNIGGTLQLVKAMELADCRRLVYSSSATVYGEPQYVPLDESHRLDAINPYGRTKLFTEAVFRDLCASDSRWDVALLRYFNPVAAHPSGDMGEHPVGVPNNLMPFVQQVAVGIRPELKVFGNDYKTRDGTAIRDYIHIMDLASAHVAACRRVLAAPFGCQAINVGTGKGTTVLEMVNSFQEASGRKIPYSFAEKRKGDAVAVWASTEKAKEVLGWEAQYSVADMCADQWRWASKWPRGYETRQDEVSPETNGNTAL